MERRKRARAAIAVLLVACLGSACSQGGTDTLPSGGTIPGSTPTPFPVLEQAKWKIAVYPVAGFGRLSKNKKTALRKQRKKLRRAVKDIYGALLLNPATMTATGKDRFAPKARRAYLDSRAGLPKGTDAVQTKKRTAAVGVEVTNMKRAAADVTIRYSAEVGARSVILRLDSTLWFERTSDGWKVIAFEMDRKRVR